MTKRILVVDDEPAVTRMVKLNLERNGDFIVRTENRGSQALAAARDFHPDVILLDVMMPDMGGEEVATQLQEDQALSQTKIIFMTAIVTQEETEETDHNIGGQVFLAKPAKTEEIIKMINVVLAQE